VHQLAADAVHALAGQPQVQAVASRVMAADGCPRLDWGWDDAIVDQLDLDDVGRFCECCFCGDPVSPLKAKAEITRSLLPDYRRASVMSLK